MSMSSAFQSELQKCVHCGLCLSACPTYRLSSNEANSPRGRLALWRKHAEGGLEANAAFDFYLDECVGCLACESACPADVPYGDLLMQVRADRVRSKKKVPISVRVGKYFADRQPLFNFATFPLRALRRLNIPSHPLVFGGKPSLCLSTADYARMLNEKHRPTGPTVALFTGCLMEAVFREINFATVRVLIAHNVRVLVPDDQTCCGALAEHCGLPKSNPEKNLEIFKGVDRVLTNSSGCGLALQHDLPMPVQDVIQFLDTVEPRIKPQPVKLDHVYLDLPCHLVHGQKIPSFPERVLDRLGVNWSYAPRAEDCCGAGGTYNITHSHNAFRILEKKSSFLKNAPSLNCALATSNHVCMMQWHAGIAKGLIPPTVKIKHLIQLLDESLSDL